MKPHGNQSVKGVTPFGQENWLSRAVGQKVDPPPGNCVHNRKGPPGRVLLAICAQRIALGVKPNQGSCPLAELATKGSCVNNLSGGFRQVVPGPLGSKLREGPIQEQGKVFCVRKMIWIGVSILGCSIVMYGQFTLHVGVSRVSVKHYNIIG